jgi:alkylation response protein AidB-like acyl-CoA dehydrogenase
VNARNGSSGGETVAGTWRDEAGAAALWPDTERFLSAEALARIAGRAAAADAEGRMANESLDELRAAGYFGLPVPLQFEGGGATLSECCAVQRRLAAADPALAIGLNMHLFTLGVMVEHWRRHQDLSWVLLEAIAGQRRLVASAFAEPGLGGSILRSGCRARPAPGGYLVSGTKAPCSLAARCDLICLQVQLDPPGPKSLLVALVPANAPGIRVERTWDSLGMRASESDTLRFDDVFVPEDLVFHRCEPGFDADDVFAAGLVWFCLTTTATYLGIVEAALAAVREALHASRVRHLAASRAELPSYQSALGDVVASVMSVEAACLGLAGALDTRDRAPAELLPAAIAVKHTAAAVCPRAVADAIELVGAPSYARTGVLARLWRDVQGARFHPPTAAASRQILGRWALGLPFTFELAERPADPGALEEVPLGAEI